MTIDSENILGDTSTEWHDRTETNPSDYISKGVHVNYSVGMGLGINYIKEFAKVVPDNAEVVVNYHVSMGRYDAIAWGTALIPKKKNE